MKYLQPIFTLTLVFLLVGCSNGKLEEKGFQVSPDNTENEPSE